VSSKGRGWSRQTPLKAPLIDCQVPDSSDDEKPSHSASVTIKSIIATPSPDARPACVLSLESSTDNLNILRDESGRIVVMRKMKVETVEHLNSIPGHWPVLTSDTAYVLDFSEDAQASTTVNLPAGKPKGLDVFLKAEVCHCSNEQCWLLIVNRIKILGNVVQMAVHLKM
jgi:hypothetical protein